MRAYQVLNSFGLDSIEKKELDATKLGRGQVRLAMKAATLNYRDLLMVKGQYNPKQTLPFVPLSDGVGEVIEVGDGVERVGPGDRVCPIFSQGWLAGEMSRDCLAKTLGGPLDGTLRDEMVVDADSVVLVPDHLSDVQAAALPCAALTAWSALVTLGGLKSGDHVLLLGTGGVSVFALQFAKAFGATVTLTSSSDEKLKRAKSLGADHLINYANDPSWGKTVRGLTSGRGVDHVVEVGGMGTLAQSLRAVRTHGTISLIGVLAGNQANTSLLPVLMNNIRVQGVFVGHRQSFESMNRCLATHGIEPVVSDVFPSDAIQDAFRHLEAGKHFGKIGISLA